MHTVKLNLKERSYKIVIGQNIIIKDLGKYLRKLKLGPFAYIITNSRIKNLYARPLVNSLREAGITPAFKIVPDTEESKSLDVSAQVIKAIAHYGKGKQIVIAAFGGGVVGDLAGFIASVYKRGTPYIQIPTTLLGQIDSSIGGKTGVDIPEGKNIVGAFYQPRLVFSDIDFLCTLSRRQIRSGLAEAVKYGIIKDPTLFNYLEKNYEQVFRLRPSALEYIVANCAYIKAKIVECDEKERKGIRTILNFGHTIGHAIEAAANYKIYNHGEAIALGMLVALDISQNLNLIKAEISQRVEGLLKRLGLPTKIQKVEIDSIINAHYLDKKFIGPKNRFVLIKDIGKAQIVENIPLKAIKEALMKRT